MAHWSSTSTTLGRTTTGSTTSARTTCALTAAAVDVLLELEQGAVSAIHGNTFRLGGGDRRARTVAVTADTTYYQVGHATTASAVQPGAVVAVYGTQRPGGVFDASIVDVFPMPRRARAGEDHLPGPNQGALGGWARVSGRVASVDGDRITLTGALAGRTGASAAETVTVGDSTRYYRGPGQPASLASISPGDFVAAIGTETAPGSLTAFVVDVHPGSNAA